MKPLPTTALACLLLGCGGAAPPPPSGPEPSNDSTVASTAPSASPTPPSSQAAAQPPPSPPPAVSRQTVLLYDSRPNALYMGGDLHDAMWKDAKPVFDVLFGTYVAGSFCPPHPPTPAPPPEQNFAPRMFGMAQGAFTAPLADETLSVVTVSNCASKPYAESTMLAVTSGSKIVAQAKLDVNPLYVGVFDLGEDGRRALVLVSWKGAASVRRLQAKVVRVGEAGLEVVRDFGMLTDACDPTQPRDIVASFTLTAMVAAGSAPEFKVETETAHCGPAKKPRIVRTSCPKGQAARPWHFGCYCGDSTQSAPFPEGQTCDNTFPSAQGSDCLWRCSP